jgi:cytochrome bd ubiquinol oxidase subunit II
MTEIITIILCISLLLYVLLAGADFGAGILELLTGNKGMRAITRAIAPIWEANHVWLVLAVVILFNGFPTVYTTLTTFLHIPILLALMGIITRGSAFAFRYYDTIKDSTATALFYSWFFRMASLLTPFFLGVIIGAVILGRIPSDSKGSFVELYIDPWCNPFAFTTGIFITMLFAWIASVYMIGETAKGEDRLFDTISLFLLIGLVASGISVFLTADHHGVHLFRRFTHSPAAIACVGVATLLIPVLQNVMVKKDRVGTKIAAGVITASIVGGFYAVQFPVMINLAGDGDLTVWNSRAPQQTMRLLAVALIVGGLIIFPSFAYLFKVFKFNADRRP